MIDIVQTLKLLVDESKAEGRPVDANWIEIGISEILETRTQLAEATRKLEEARKDAERWRFVVSSDDYGICSYVDGRGSSQGRSDYEWVSAEALDQAIEQGKGGDDAQ
jgi:hypothetical protein